MELGYGNGLEGGEGIGSRFRKGWGLGRNWKNFGDVFVIDYGYARLDFVIGR